MSAQTEENNPAHHIREYLSKQGYPLEMFVAQQFRKAGFDVYQSTFYIDKETKKNREIDVVALFPIRLHNDDFDVTLNFKVVIECKFAKNSWILFSGENDSFKELQIDNFYCCNYAGSQILNRLSISQGFTNRNWFKNNLKLGYGLTEAKEKNSDNETTFKAITTLINYLEFERDSPEDLRNKPFNISIPVIVIQGNLFECFLNELNKEEINEIREGQLIYKSNIYPNVYPIIDVVTKDEVSNLAERLKIDFWKIANDYQDKLEPLFKKYPIDPNIRDIDWVHT